MKKILQLLSILAILGTIGCYGPDTYVIDQDDDRGKAVMALDYRDFQSAAQEMVKSVLSSGRLQKADGSRYVVTTGRIINDTMQHIDTDQLMAKIEEDLMNSGQVVMTSAVGGNGSTDTMIDATRELRDDDEFNQGTIAKKGTLLSPDLSIAGKILQRNIRYSDKIQQVEYYFQLRITDLRTGLRFWQKENIIGKRGSNKAVSW